MATLHRIRLEFCLPEDEPHETVPRVDDELVVTIANRMPRVPCADAAVFKVLEIREIGDDPAKQEKRKALVWAERIHEPAS